jgi:hypothetical protein
MGCMYPVSLCCSSQYGTTDGDVSTSHGDAVAAQNHKTLSWLVSGHDPLEIYTNLSISEFEV